MENPSTPRIGCVDRMGGDIIITFDDGKIAVYPAALLYAMFPQADPVAEIKLTEED